MSGGNSDDDLYSSSDEDIYYLVKGTKYAHTLFMYSETDLFSGEIFLSADRMTQEVNKEIEKKIGDINLYVPVSKDAPINFVLMEGVIKSERSLWKYSKAYFFTSMDDIFNVVNPYIQREQRVKKKTHLYRSDSGVKDITKFYKFLKNYYWFEVDNKSSRNI